MVVPRSPLVPFEVYVCPQNVVNDLHTNGFQEIFPIITACSVFIRTIKKMSSSKGDDLDRSFERCSLNSLERFVIEQISDVKTHNDLQESLKNNNNQ